MKRCRTCNGLMPLGAFYLHASMKDGRLNHCKLCVGNRVKKYRSENLEKVRAADRSRGRLAHRLAANRSRCGSPASNRAKAKWRKLNPQKVKAQRILRRAMLKGTVVKVPCEQCSGPIVEAHHPDYSKPLEVKWLCLTCHKIAHRKYRSIP